MNTFFNRISSTQSFQFIKRHWLLFAIALAIGIIVSFSRSTEMIWTRDLMVLTIVFVSLWMVIYKRREIRRAIKNKRSNSRDKPPPPPTNTHVVRHEDQDQRESDETQLIPTIQRSDTGNRGEETASDSQEKSDVELLTDQMALLIQQLTSQNLGHLVDEQDQTLYWERRPHGKYFLKRVWKIILCWGIVVLVTPFLWAGSNELSLPWRIPATLAPMAIGAWYCYRVYYKWTHLLIRVKGKWAYIVEPRNGWLVLTGTTQSAPLISCNNMQSQQTSPEQIFRFKCGKLDINTPVDKKDKFRNLTDVADFEELEQLIRDRHDVILMGSPTASRQLFGN